MPLNSSSYILRMETSNWRTRLQRRRVIKSVWKSSIYFFTASFPHSSPTRDNSLTPMGLFKQQTWMMEYYSCQKGFTSVLFLLLLICAHASVYLYVPIWCVTTGKYFRLLIAAKVGIAPESMGFCTVFKIFYLKPTIHAFGDYCQNPTAATIFLTLITTWFHFTMPTSFFKFYIKYCFLLLGVNTLLRHYVMFFQPLHTHATLLQNVPSQVSHPTL